VTAIDRPSAVPLDIAGPLELAFSSQGIAPIGSQVIFFPVATSTNDLALRLADHGCPDGTVVIADQQTAGRGRGSHSWHSPAGSGLYVSVVVRVDLARAGREHGAADWPRWLTLATGVALAEGLHAASGLPVSIKWPNDLVMAPAGTVRGARKLGGVLAEGRTDAGQLTHVVVGFGVNVRSSAFPPEISARATSLEDELGRDIDRGAVLAALLKRFSMWLARLRAQRSADVAARWSALAVGATGSTVEWRADGGPRRGVTAGIDGEGALLIRAGASTERVVSGEVIWL
jgi:BirA family transcriptional regulator, biotin operon repressor / biotin---[acetyl-CoA-carboxylase] ligase